MTEGANTPVETPKPPRRTGLRVLLFLSLALNLVVAGLVGGAVLKYRGDDDSPRLLARELGLGPYMFALEPDQERFLMRAAGERARDLRPARSDWRRAFNETTEAIRSDPFDAERFRAAMQRQSDLAASGREVGLEVMTEVLANMTAEGRNAYADRLEQRARFNPRQRDRDGKGGPRTAHPPKQQD